MYCFFFFQRKDPAIHASLHKRVPNNSNEQPKLDLFVDNTKKYAVSDPRQKKITDSLVKFIAENLISLSVVESEPFKDLIGLCEPRYQVPSRKHFTSKLLYEKSVEVKNDLTHQLKMAQDVCVTIDLWSNRQMKSFIGITGHYILDWTLKSVMLACKRFKGKHTADNIAKEFDETMCTPTPALSEVQKYLELSIQDPDSNPLETWRQYEKDLPRIAKLARKYLCLAASSAPVERLFSVAGKVFRPDRCRVSDKVFESLMMIKCGQK